MRLPSMIIAIGSTITCSSYRATLGRVRFALASLLLLAGCRSSAPPARPLTAWIPSDTVVLAGVHLDQVRQNLPESLRAFLEPLQGAKDLLVAYNGRDVLIVAEGNFPSAPQGGVLVSPTIALAGAASSIDAAKRQGATGRTGVPELVARADSVAKHAVWVVANGQAPLPFRDNLANVTRLLRLTDYAAGWAELRSDVNGEITAVCAREDAAAKVEETLRAMVTLGAAATRDTSVAAAWRATMITREKATVHVVFSAPVNTLQQLLY